MANKDEQERLVEAMEVAGMHYDIYDSAPDSLRFTSEMGIVTYFESWDEVTNWIEGTVFDDPEVEQEVDEILHPEKYEDKEITVLVVQPEMEPEVRQISTGLEALSHNEEIAYEQAVLSKNYAEARRVSWNVFLFPIVSQSAFVKPRQILSLNLL